MKFDEESNFDLITPTKPQSSSDWTPNGTGISTIEGIQFDPRVISDGEGGAIVVWWNNQSNSYSIRAQRIDSKGEKKWHPDGNLIGWLYNLVNPYFDICSDGMGGFYLSFLQYDIAGTQIRIQRIDQDGSPKWAGYGGYLVDKGSLPKICSDGNTGCIITWEKSAVEVRVQKYNSSGAKLWSTDGVLLYNLSLGGESLYPQITNDGKGGAIVTWMDIDMAIDPKVYAQRVDTDGKLNWTINGKRINTIWGLLPRICTDENGGAFISWEDNSYDILVQRIASNGTKLWDTNGVVVCPASGSLKHDHKICSDGEEGVIICWNDDRYGNQDIFAQRVDKNGDRQWTNNGITACRAVTSQWDPKLCRDEHGGAYISWEDNRNGNYDIFIQHITKTGNVEYYQNGIGICTFNGDQINSQLCSDGLGGTFIVWEDNRNGIDSKIYIYYSQSEKEGNGWFWILFLLISIIISFIIIITLIVRKILKKNGREEEIVKPPILKIQDQIIYEKCKEVALKIPKYKDKKLQISNFLDFIKQFPEKLRIESLQLIENILYINFEEMTQKLNTLINQIMPTSGAIYIIVFEKFKLKSSGAWSYFASHFSGTKYHFLSSKDLIKGLKNIRKTRNELKYSFIFLDDVIGTGHQFVDTFKEELGKKLEMIKEIKDKVKFYLVAGVGSDDSIEFIKNETSIFTEDTIRYSHKLNMTQKAFYTSNWKNEEKLEELKEFLRGTHKTSWNGYNDSQYLVVLEWNTPDNTIGCLWEETKDWVPLFPRD